MIKTERGDKRRCLACNTAFFDLNRTPILCPKCDEVFQVVELIRSPPRNGVFLNANGARWRSAPRELPADEIEAPCDEHEAGQQEVDEDTPAASDDEIQEADEISEVGGEMPEIDDESPDAETIRQFV